MIHEEIARLEKLQRLAEKIHQEAKITDSKLDDIEAWIEDEVSRLRLQLCFVKGLQIGARIRNIPVLSFLSGSTIFSS
jgi:hypothetical protein